MADRPAMVSDDRLLILEDLVSPVWLYSCREKRNLWANTAALRYFNRSIKDFLDPDVYNNLSSKTHDPEVFQVFEKANEEMEQKVEVEGNQQQLHVVESTDILPGWCKPFHHMGKLDQKLMYKQFNIRRDDEDFMGTLVQLEPPGHAQDMCEISMMRLMVMHQFNPINSFLFDENGALLLSNPSAQKYYKDHQKISLSLFFQEAIYSDQRDWKHDYEQAVKTVFKEHKSCRIQQRRFSHKDPSKMKWSELEMWPMTDPITNRPAVLVSRLNITKSKEAEEGLKVQRNQLQSERDRLALELKATYQDKKSAFDQASPLEMTVNFLDQIMEGSHPSMSELAGLKNLLLTSENLTQPAQLKEQLLSENAFEKEVGLNLLQLLSKDNSQAGVSPESTETVPALKGKPTFSRKMIQRGLMENSIIPGVLIPAVEQVLMRSEQWTWNAFDLAEVTEGCPCSVLAFWTLKKSGLITHFQLDEVKLSRFLRRIEEGYPQNPYHNRVHACDVLQSMHMVVIKGGLYPTHVDKLCQLAAYVAAIMHDFEHGGVNNDYLIKSADTLAVRYNDRSPLENHHLAGAFQVLRHPECFFLGKLSRSKVNKFRQFCIDMVLATDMKQHFNILSQFQAKLNKFSASSPIAGEHPVHETGMDETQLSLVLQIAMKCADVGHLACERNVHRRWVSLLEEEFFRQGDQERMNGMNISPLMDRKNPGITKSQVGFFDIVAMPLFRSFTSLFPGCNPMIEAVEDNFLMWQEAEQSQKGVKA